MARTLAQTLHFNYVYGVEFVELNRLYLGERHIDIAAPHEQVEEFGVDPKRVSRQSSLIRVRRLCHKSRSRTVFSLKV